MATTNPGWTDNTFEPLTGKRETVTEEAKRRAQVRRRIEDMHEAARIRDEALWEVWGEDMSDM